MSVDPKFFKEGETSFGIFYPEGYLLSAFPDAATAARAVDALRGAGVAPNDVSVASGAEVLERHEAFTADRGLVDRFRQFVSHLYGDEADMLDGLLGLARRGHTFVLAYAPHDADTTRAADAVRPLGPVVLRKYDALTVTDLG